MGWEAQGRQEHGWFGHGTSAVDEPSPEEAARGVVEAAARSLPSREARALLAFTGRDGGRRTTRAIGIYPSGIAFLNEIGGANDDFIRELTETGGEVALVFDLPGDVNVGSALDAAEVARLAKLRVELSTEVFPRFAPGARGRARAASTA